MRLGGKVALITGGSLGMGAAEARLFVREGAMVVIGDILESEGRQIESEINGSGGEALFIKLDVTKAQDWQRAINATVTQFGKLNVLVNNAGIIIRAPLEETTEDIWNRVLDVNAKGVFLGTKLVMPEMRKAGGGSIVNVSSISGMVSLGFPAYNASKGAVRVFTKNVAVEYAKDNVRVNSIHPGIIKTRMTEDDPRLQEQRNNLIPMMRLGEPEEVAFGAMFLASEEASYITGSELVIDGGWTAQ